MRDSSNLSVVMNHLSEERSGPLCLTHPKCQIPGLFRSLHLSLASFIGCNIMQGQGRAWTAQSIAATPLPPDNDAVREDEFLEHLTTGSTTARK